MKLKFWNFECSFDRGDVEAAIKAIKNFWFNCVTCRCPKCKSRKVSFYEYLGCEAEAIPRYKCYECGSDSILAGNDLVEVTIK
jgi:transposase-like protein